MRTPEQDEARFSAIGRLLESAAARNGWPDHALMVKYGEYYEEMERLATKAVRIWDALAAEKAAMKNKSGR